MSLARRLADLAAKHPELANTPVPIIDKATEVILGLLPEVLWPDATVEDIAIDEFHWCEACGEVIVRDDPESHLGVGEDRVDLHGSCVEQEGAA